MAKVADLLLGRDERQIVVVSAMSGVTDALISLVTLAGTRGDFSEGLAALERKHLETARALLGDTAMQAWLRAQFASLADLLHALRR